MKKKAIDSILSFINRYRAVTFGALRMNIPHISDETIFSDTTRLCKRRLISYEKKKRDIDSPMYFSETFNREHTKTVFDNTEIAYQTALKAIGILRRYLKITYEEPSFFPIPVKFGYIDSEGEEQNAQLIYLEYWENQMMAKKIAQMLDAGYDARFAPSRFVILEARVMLNADTLRELYDYIPNTVQYIHVVPHAKKGADVTFYQPQDFGLTDNGVVL